MNELKTIILHNSFSKLKKMTINLFDIQFYITKQTNENEIPIDIEDDASVDVDVDDNCDDWYNISTSSFYLIDLTSDAA